MKAASRREKASFSKKERRVKVSSGGNVSTSRVLSSVPARLLLRIGFFVSADFSRHFTIFYKVERSRNESASMPSLCRRTSPIPLSLTQHPPSPPVLLPSSQYYHVLSVSIAHLLPAAVLPTTLLPAASTLLRDPG